jgi:hypothetical protein
MSDDNINASATVDKKILDVGCGQNKFPGAIGIDANPRSHADVIHDLGNFPIHSKAMSSMRLFVGM